MQTKALSASRVPNPRLLAKRTSTKLLESFAAAQNKCLDLVHRPVMPDRIDFPELNEVLLQTHSKKTDINDHLLTLFIESLSLQPSLIVELGVRGGESTSALERAARLCNSVLLSVDLDDCEHVSGYEKRYFIKSDDVALAERFPQWCKEHELRTAVDVLFIDTSHEFEHTTQEIQSWFPLLADHCKVFFHDTNMSRVFRRRDGSIGVGWNNQRGVIAAVENYLNCHLDEHHDFTTIVGDWLVRHSASCNGMTVLERWRKSASQRTGV